VVVSYLVLAAMLAVVITPWALVAAAMLIVALVGLNADYYRWFARERGVWFAVRVVGAHLVHHLCNGVSFVAGTVLHLASRVGLRLPGAFPDTRWTADRAGLPAPPRIQPSR
jgi:hypothetical protein